VDDPEGAPQVLYELTESEEKDGSDPSGWRQLQIKGHSLTEGVAAPGFTEPSWQAGNAGISGCLDNGVIDDGTTRGLK